jgi:hypothetical protein
VDEGTIKVTADTDHMLIETTKRVRFSGPIDAPSIAMLACGAGYGALAADFVSDLVATVGGAAREVSCVTDEPQETPLVEQPGEGQPSGGDPIDKAIGLMNQTVDECADAFKAAYARALQGRYKADDLAADMSGAFARNVQAWARMVNAATSLTSYMASFRPGSTGPTGPPGPTPTGPTGSTGTASTESEAAEPDVAVASDDMGPPP